MSFGNYSRKSITEVPYIWIRHNSLQSKYVDRAIIRRHIFYRKSNSPLHFNGPNFYAFNIFKATNIKENQHVAMRRVQNFKLVNSKCMVLVEQWRKLSHSNLVALRQVFTTKEFGDQSIIFVYDFYPGAETLMAKHFTNSPSIPGNPAFLDPFW